MVNSKEERRGIQIASYLLYFKPRREENFHIYHRRTQNIDKVFEEHQEMNSHGNKQVERTKST